MASADNPEDVSIDFQKRIDEILSIPGITKRQLAGWAHVDASTVTRWHRDGVTPADPVKVLARLRPHVDRARESVATLRNKPQQIDSWRPLLLDLKPGIREYVEQTGLLASSYYAISSWVPQSRDPETGLCDVTVVRFFDGVWADMSKRLYNIGDLSQTLSFAGDGQQAPGVPMFDQEASNSDLVRIVIESDNEVGKSIARLHVQLDLQEYRLDPGGGPIGFVDSFDYRYRATNAVATHRSDCLQATNDFLGAPVPVTCREFHLIVCISKDSVRGSPSALSASNRSMAKVLSQLDNASPSQVESLLWPSGRRYELSSSPDSRLKHVMHADSMIDALPHRLQEVLDSPVSVAEGRPVTIQDIMRSEDSICYRLNLHAPHPSLTNTIVWRLAEEAGK